MDLTVRLNAATAEQSAFVGAATVGRLATVDAAGRPHAVPICFALLEGRIYSPLDEKPKRVGVERLRRVRNILANPHICLVVDRYAEDWSELAWVQVRGTASLVQPGSGEHAGAIAALRERYVQYRAMRLEERPLIRLDPGRVLSWGI